MEWIQVGNQEAKKPGSQVARKPGSQVALIFPKKNCAIIAAHQKLSFDFLFRARAGKYL